MKVGNYEQMMAYLKDPFNPSELRARVKELEQEETFEPRMDFDKGGMAKLVSYVESLPKGSTVTTKMLEDYISKNKLKVNLGNFFNRKAGNIKNVKFDRTYEGSRLTNEQIKNVENWKKNNPNKNYDDLSTEAKTRVRKGQNVGAYEVTQKEKYADAYEEAYKFYESKGLEPDVETIRKIIVKNDGKFVPPTRKLKGEAGLTGLLKNYEMDDLLKDLRQGKNLAEISIEYFDKNEKEVLKSLEGKRDYTKPLGRISTDLGYAISRNKEATKLYNKIKKQQSFDRLKNKNKYLKEVETLLPFAQEQGLVPEINPFNGKKIDTGSKYFQFAYKMKRDPIAKLFGFYEKVGVEHPAGVARALIFDDPATLNEIVATMPDTNIASGSTYDAYATGQARFFEKTGDPKYIKKINQIILNKKKEFGKPRTILDIEGDNVTRRATDFSLTNPNYFKDAKSFINEYIAAGGSKRKNFNKLDSNLQKAIKLYEKGNQVEGNKNLKIAVNTVLDKEQRIVKLINSYRDQKANLKKEISAVYCGKKNGGRIGFAEGPTGFSCSIDEIETNMKRDLQTEAGRSRVRKILRGAGTVLKNVIAPVDAVIESAFMLPSLLAGDPDAALNNTTLGFIPYFKTTGAEKAQKLLDKGLIDQNQYNEIIQGFKADEAIAGIAKNINDTDQLILGYENIGILSNRKGEKKVSQASPERIFQLTEDFGKKFVELAEERKNLVEQNKEYAPAISTISGMSKTYNAFRQGLIKEATTTLSQQPFRENVGIREAIADIGKQLGTGEFLRKQKMKDPRYVVESMGDEYFDAMNKYYSPYMEDVRSAFTGKDPRDRYSELPISSPSALAQTEKIEYIQGMSPVLEKIYREQGPEEMKTFAEEQGIDLSMFPALKGVSKMEEDRINFANGGRLTFSDGSPKDPSKRSTLKKIGIGGGVAGGLATGLINLLDFFRGGSKVTKAQEAVRRASRAEEIFFDLVRNVKNKGVMREARFTGDEPGGVIYEHAGVKVIDDEPYIRAEFETDKGAPAVIEYRKPGYDVDPNTQTTIKDPGGFEYEGQEVGRIRPNGDVDIDFEEEIIDEITNVEKIAKGD